MVSMLNKSLTLLSTLLVFVVHANETIIENVTVISAHLDAPLTHQNVHIKDGRIVSVTHSPIQASSDSAQTISGEGKFLTFGLMDSHVHVGSIPGIGFIDSDRARQHPELVADYMQQQPKSFLYHGVTQVLNLGSSNGKEQFTKGELHPDFFTCQPIPVVGGYPDTDAEHTLSRSANFIIEPGMENMVPASVNHSRHTPEAVVARIASSGTRCIKLYFEDGFGEASHWPMMSDATVARVRKAASAHNIQLIAHANAIDMYQAALKHKVDVFAHGIWNWHWPEDKGEPPVADTLDQVMSQGAAYMPTIQVMQALRGMFDAKFIADTSRADVLPQSILDWYQTEDAQWFKEELRTDFGGQMDDATLHKILGYGVGRAKRATQYVASQDYPVLLASDYPSSPSYAAAPGLSTLHELYNLAEAGVSAQAIFEAATFNGPKQFGLHNDYGTVEPGKVANLLLLNSNPLEDVEAWADIEQILLRGVLLNKSSLIANKKAEVANL